LELAPYAAYHANPLPGLTWDALSADQREEFAPRYAAQRKAAVLDMFGKRRGWHRAMNSSEHAMPNMTDFFVTEDSRVRELSNNNIDIKAI